MKKISIALVFLILLGLLFWTVFQKKSGSVLPPAKEGRPLVVARPPPVLPGPEKNSPRMISEPSLLGETILHGYGTSTSTPENDLTLMAHLMENFSLLVKSSANFPMSVNEEWAAAFRGKNPAHERFLPDAHTALNAQGQLVDRWKTPLFFHALGNHRFEIRSAGSDKKMWTEDDLHRNADGSFRRGAALNPPSLLESAPLRAGH